MRVEKALGGYDWRLPKRRELRNLMSYQTRKPALPHDHPFLAEPDWAWALYLHKGATGVGQKPGPHFFVWPCA